jgi:hypothetical protein
VLVVDATPDVHDERSTGGVLNVIEPLPVRDDRSTDDQATQREHDTRSAVLALGESVDRPDHGFQRWVHLRHNPALGHAVIVHHRGLVEHNFLARLAADGADLSLSTVVFVEGKPQRPHRRLVALSGRPLVLRSSVVNSVGEQIPSRTRHWPNVRTV